MDDSGKRQEFSSGAVRDTAENKPRIDLISPYAQWRCGEWLRLGAEKYTERNWEQGIPFGRCMASLERHVQEYKMGKTNEDHLAAIIVNAQFIMHYEKMIELGKLPASLNDLPQYEKQREDTESEVFGGFTIKKAQDKSKGWYIILTETIKRPWGQFLYKDLGLHSCRGWTGGEAYGCAPGYYDSKEHAKVHITAYEKQKKFVCPAGWVIRFHDGCGDNNCGWYVCKSGTPRDEYLHKGGTLHTSGGTGIESYYRFGEAPGYWPTKEAAEKALTAYLEKGKS